MPKFAGVATRSHPLRNFCLRARRSGPRAAHNPAAIGGVQERMEPMGRVLADLCAFLPRINRSGLLRQLAALATAVGVTAVHAQTLAPNPPGRSNAPEFRT